MVVKDNVYKSSIVLLTRKRKQQQREASAQPLSVTSRQNHFLLPLLVLLQPTLVLSSWQGNKEQQVSIKETHGTAAILHFFPKKQSLKWPWSFASLTGQVFWVPVLACQLQLRPLGLQAAAFQTQREFPKAPGPSLSYIGKVPKRLHSKHKPVFQVWTTCPCISKPGAILLQSATEPCPYHHLPWRKLPPASSLFSFGKQFLRLYWVLS